MEYTLNLTNWHEFLSSLTSAGFRQKRMVTSEAALLYGYALWLIGKTGFRSQPRRSPGCVCTLVLYDPYDGPIHKLP